MEKNFDEILKKVYYDASKGFSSVQKIYKRVKEIDPSITIKIVKDFVQRQDTAQINKEVKKKKTKTFQHITGGIGHFQTDITDYPKYYKQNNGNRYILCMIEINSRKAYAVPLKTKTKSSVVEGIKSMIEKVKEEGNKINVLQSDMGNEFKNNQMKSLLVENSIEQRFCNVGDKKCMSIVERFNRTIRSLITKYMVANNTTKWVDKLGEFVENYNSSYHSAIKTEPNNVDEKMEVEIIKDKITENFENKEQILVNVGDKIRIKLKKGLFKKLGRNFSDEVYIVVKVNRNSVKVNELDKLIRKEDIQVVPQSSNTIDTKKIKRVEKKDKIKRQIRRELG